MSFRNGEDEADRSLSELAGMLLKDTLKDMKLNMTIPSTADGGKAVIGALTAALVAQGFGQNPVITAVTTGATTLLSISLADWAYSSRHPVAPFLGTAALPLGIAEVVGGVCLGTVQSLIWEFGYSGPEVFTVPLSLSMAVDGVTRICKALPMMEKWKSYGQRGGWTYNWQFEEDATAIESDTDTAPTTE